MSVKAKPKSGSRKVVSSAKRKRSCPVGVAHVRSGFNNTIVTITDLNGQTLAQASGGSTQKGTRKSTPHAAQEAAKIAGKKVLDMGMVEVRVILRGTGPGREAVVKGLAAIGIKISVIADKTPLAHGGVRRRKKKRI